MFDLFQQVREELQLEVVRDGELVRPLVYQKSGNAQMCYNSGGRGIVFPYENRAIRVKGIIDPDGKLTRRIAASPRNQIEDVKRFTQYRPDNLSNGKPFAVLSQQAAKREQEAVSRLNWSYWKIGLKHPYSVLDVVPTGQTFDGGPTVQLYFDLPSVEDDLRVEELNGLLRAKMNRLSSQEIKEREGDVLKLYHRFMQWHGFSARCLTISKLLPTPESFVPQNYVISHVKGGYGLFRVDHTSTVPKDVDDEKAVFEELVRRISKGQSDGPISTFGNLPTAVVLAANHSDQVPMDSRSLFERCYYFDGRFKASDRYLQALNIFYRQFTNGIRMPQPEPIEEEFFRKPLAD
ncbi:MAG: hypothetical protein HYU56_03990 [Candidatus Aenigmarchaeota archaeon]|nr:hypothetical protein [Candidatus Aenigmarchaeota archaeon]